jgi:autotransporter-associated beta strand protein
MKVPIPTWLRVIPLALGLLFALNTARGATTWYWDGSTVNLNGASDNTTTTSLTWLGTGAGAGNWDNGTVDAPLSAWTAGDSAVFGGSAASEAITASALTLGNLTFGSGGAGTGTGTTPAYTISSSTITLSTGSTITANTPTTISSVLAGSPSLTVGGPATLTLSGVNTYSGGTTISSGGTLTIGGSGKLAAAGNITDDGNFNYNSSASLSLSGVISGSGSLAVGGTGTLTLSKAETYSGDTTIGTAGSTLTLATGGKLGNGTYNGNITNNGTLNYNNAASARWNGVISGTGSLSVNPSGAQGSQVYLSGVNTYSGKTTIALNGQVIITDDSGLGTPPATFTANQLTMNLGFLKASGTFTLNANRGITLLNQVPGIGASIQVDPGYTLTVAAPITGPNGFLSGSGLANFGLGTNLLTAHSTYIGATGISTGTLRLGTDGALPYGTSLLLAPDISPGSPGAIFDLGGFSQTIGPLGTTNSFTGVAASTGIPTIVLNGALTILQTNTTTVFSGLITGSGTLTIKGNSSGTLVLSNYANTYTGLTTINGGTLEGSGSGSIPGDVTVNYGGTLKLDDPSAMSPTATLTFGAAPGASIMLNLNFSGTQTISALYGPAPQATGLWGAVGNAGATYTDSRIIGPGLLRVCPAPQTITPAASSVCAGATTTASVPVTPGATYAWAVNNGTITSGATSSTVTYNAWATDPVTLNCVVTSPCGAQSAGGQNVNVTVNICGQVVQSTNILYDAVNGATITGMGVMGASWSLNASDDVTTPLPWPIILGGTVTSSPFTVNDPDAINHSQRFYYLTNSP